ncbi:unnamed protein product [Ilex paraguariensis]|uniref:Uncharacterized protein n=1 Tax=Ilex paraguariensis TaxID=185542 RepID=A0ABC8S5V0_9AQUA
MDINSKSVSWFGNIRQEFAAFYSELEDIVCQEKPYEYVEGQLLRAGANVKQFCSDIVQDVLPEFIVDSTKEESPDPSLEQDTNMNRMACERLKVGVEKDLKEGLCDVNSLSHASVVEQVVELHIDSSLEQNADVGMLERSNVGVKGNEVDGKLFPSEIPEVADPAEEHLSIRSSVCGGNWSNDEKKGCSGEVCLSTLISVEFHECNSSMKAGEPSDLVDAKPDIPEPLPSADSVILTESYTSTSDESVSSPESCLSGFEAHNEFVEFESFLCHPDFGDTNTEESRDDHVNESAMEATQQFSKLKNRSYQETIEEFSALEMKFAKEQECGQQATCPEDLHAESGQPIRKYFTRTSPTGELESPDYDFCDSDWEII